MPHGRLWRITGVRLVIYFRCFRRVYGRENVRFHLGRVYLILPNETIMDRMPGIFTWKAHGYYNKRGVLTNSLSSDLETC